MGVLSFIGFSWLMFVGTEVFVVLCFMLVHLWYFITMFLMLMLVSDRRVINLINQSRNKPCKNKTRNLKTPLQKAPTCPCWAVSQFAALYGHGRPSHTKACIFSSKSILHHFHVALMKEHIQPLITVNGNPDCRSPKEKIIVASPNFCRKSQNQSLYAEVHFE